MVIIEALQDGGELGGLQRFGTGGKLLAGEPSVAEQRAVLLAGQASGSGDLVSSHLTEKEGFKTAEMLTVPAEVARHHDAALEHGFGREPSLLVQFAAGSGDRRLTSLEPAPWPRPGNCPRDWITPAEQHGPAAPVRAQHRRC